MSDEARRPADAYFEMVELVGESYLSLPPPSKGKVLTVVGKDGVTTEWWVTDAHGHELVEKIRANKNLRLVSARRHPAEA